MEDQKHGAAQMNKNEDNERRAVDDEAAAAAGYGLSLSLSLLQHPSTQRSNASSTSEISEAFSSYHSRSDFKDSFGSFSEERSINLDLSIALCGN